MSHPIYDKRKPRCPLIDIKILLIKVISPPCSCKTGTCSEEFFCFVFLNISLGTSHLQRWTAKWEGRNKSTKLGNIHERSLTFLKVTLFRKTVLKKKKNVTIFIMPPRFWISNGGHVALEQIEMKSVSSPAILCCSFFPLSFSTILLHRSILMRALHVVSLGSGNCSCTRVLSQPSIIRWLDPSVTHYGYCAVISIHIVPYVSIA